MKSPRRIFRPSSSTWSSRAGKAVLGWLAASVVVAGVIGIGWSSDLFGRAPGGPERLQAEPNQVAVIDGDTLRLGGRVIRLAGIEAPVRGDLCRGGTDCGGAATMLLAGLVRDRRIDCRLTGNDGMGRPYGACDVNGTDLSSAVVASGWARARPDAPALADLELRARKQGAGLWGDASRR